MKLQEIIAVLEEIAPPVYQEGYDNSGLLIGSPDKEVNGALITLDCTPEVIAEAVQKGVNLVIAHHPIIFKGLERLNGKNYVERTVIEAIRQDIAVYAIHTNLDNVISQGVNSMIARRIGVENTRILAPKKRSVRIDAVVDSGAVDFVVQAIEKLPSAFEAGVESLSDRSKELLQIVSPQHMQSKITAILKEFGAHDAQILALENETPEIGSGLIGELPQPMDWTNFFRHVKKEMGLTAFRHTALNGKAVKRVAICGGAGSFLLSTARRQNADVFISSDFKYHEFFDAENDIVIMDIGHYESERFTVELLEEIISKKIRNFAPLKSEFISNPVKYYI